MTLDKLTMGIEQFSKPLGIAQAAKPLGIEQFSKPVGIEQFSKPLGIAQAAFSKPPGSSLLASVRNAEALTKPTLFDQLTEATRAAELYRRSTTGFERLAERIAATERVRAEETRRLNEAMQSVPSPYRTLAEALQLAEAARTELESAMLEALKELAAAAKDTAERDAAATREAAERDAAAAERERRLVELAENQFAISKSQARMTWIVVGISVLGLGATLGHLIIATAALALVAVVRAVAAKLRRT